MEKPICVILILGAAFPVLLSAEDVKPADKLSVRGEWAYHFRGTFGPAALAGGAVLAGAAQAMGTPSGWPTNGQGYGRRLASTLATNAIRHGAELGLDLAVSEDPRYVRLAKSGFGGRVRHAVVSEFVAGAGHGRRPAYSRIGSALIAGYVSTAWRPDARAANGLKPAHQGRARLGLEQAGIIVGLDVLSNIGSEIWPGLRKKLFRR